MLRMLNRAREQMQECTEPLRAPRPCIERDELTDVKTAIELLYKFKKDLNELSPIVVEIIENLLQRPRY